MVQEWKQSQALVNVVMNFILACMEGGLFVSYTTSGLSRRTTLRGVNHESRVSVDSEPLS